MKRKLQTIKEEAQQLTAEISSGLRQSAKELKKIQQPPFKTLEEFDDWFQSESRLTL